MHLEVPPDLEKLIEKRISTGAYSGVEDVLRRALEAQDAEESWSEEERRALSDHIEERFRESETSGMIDGEQARRDIEAMKNAWRSARR